MNSNSTFFERDNYFIDQKAFFSKPYIKYQIFNNNKENIGFIKEKMTLGNIFLRQILGRTISSSEIEIRSTNGTLEAILSRKRFFKSNKITILDPRRNVLGSIKKKRNFIKSNYLIVNTFNEVIAEISGDNKEYNFMITDACKDKIGSIDKKLEGIMTKIYKSGNKYNVTIKTNFLNKNDKIVIFSSAIAMYMI